MKPIRRLSLAEQTAAHLREGLRSGRWGASLPGVLRLATMFDVSKDIVREALRQLESEGVLSARGHGRGRAVASIATRAAGAQKLRVAILTNARPQDESGLTQRLLLRLQHDIDAAGHVCIFAAESQADLHCNLRRLSRLVDKTRADAWLVVGASLEILNWFAAQKTPAIALGGRRDILAAGVGMDGVEAFTVATRRLVALGHRRIVFICPREWRLPVPGRIIETFQHELAAAGIPAGDYHIPDWIETPEGFQKLLGSLFRVTPPTALIVDEPHRTVATVRFLAERGLRVPRDVSLISLNITSSLTWCRPPLAHFQCDIEPIIRYVVRWLGSVARGKPAGKQLGCPMTFDPGGTIAEARK